MKIELDVVTLSQYLKLKILEKGVTYRYAASEFGCAIATVSRILSGKNFDRKWIIPIAKFCGISSSELWELLENENTKRD